MADQLRYPDVFFSPEDDREKENEGNGDVLETEREMGGGGEEDVTSVTWREHVFNFFCFH